MGSDYEFFQRPEWKALKGAYRLEFERLVTLDPTLMYSAIDQQDVDVISAYSTDGRIAAYKLAVLAYPRQALPPYDAVLLVSARAADRKGLRQVLQSMIGVIDDDLMRATNKLVDVDGVSVDSAAQFMNAAIEAARR